jgi:uncharacterized phage protein (TIGR02218 family)
MTTRHIPLLLGQEMALAAATMTWLLKMVFLDGTIVTVTSLDHDFDYDDGNGVLTYDAAIGYQNAARDASSFLDVDNSDATLLTFPDVIDDAIINSGQLDFGRYWIYGVNYKKPNRGHFVEMAGYLGAIKSMDGLGARVELRGLSQRLKQSVIELYSTTCRAAFGSTGRYGCNFDAESLWDSDTIASVDADEPDRIFTATTTPAATGPNGALEFKPGLVMFTAGKNAGAVIEIEAVDGKEITLRFPVPFDITTSDEFDIRPDCDKRYEETCIAHYDNQEWFRGEPYIIPGDEASQGMPGASAPIYPGYMVPEAEEA